MKKRNYSGNMKNFQNTDLEQWAEGVRKIHYSKLTEHQWDMLRVVWVVNWFWPSSQPILWFILKKLTPSFDEFSANVHDFSFWKWWTIYDFEKSNNVFLHLLIKDAKKQKSILKLYYIFFAIAYYFWVKIFWKKYFNFH